jgi:hypothetical protein
VNRLIIAALAAAALSGCANIKLAQPQVVVENVAALRSANIPAIGAGKFALEAGKPAGIDKKVTVRGSPITVEGGGAFSQHLKATLVSDLKAAGKYDPAAPLIIEGELTDNTLNAAGTRTADAFMAVRFRVMRDGLALYDRRIEQRARWESSFVGMIAIPDAINRFTEQFRLVLLKLYQDPDFLRAVKPVGG